MLVAQYLLLAGHGHVQGLGLEFLGQGLFFNVCPGAFYGAFDVGPNLVGQLADDRPFLGRQASHLLEDAGELALFA